MRDARKVLGAHAPEDKAVPLEGSQKINERECERAFELVQNIHWDDLARAIERALHLGTIPFFYGKGQIYSDANEVVEKELAKAGTRGCVAVGASTEMHFRSFWSLCFRPVEPINFAGRTTQSKKRGA
jgi:hypothetical protein